MKVRFWGVRGSIAVSGTDYLHTGGNTTCVEITSGGHRLILDGGTGLRALGASLGVAPLEATLLFTHLHWDHIQGVPFFMPAYHPDSELTFMGMDRPSGGLRDALAGQMHPPQFPVTLDELRGAKHFRDVRPDRPFDVGPFHVVPLDFHHPDGVVAFRIEADGRSCVFATDVEHKDGIERSLVDLCHGADLLIHDAQYTSDEYTGASGGPSKVGWGHSTWDEAVSVAQHADVQRLALFHHDPDRIDDEVAVIESWAQERFPAAFAAREGAAIAL